MKDLIGKSFLFNLFHKTGLFLYFWFTNFLFSGILGGIERDQRPLKETSSWIFFANWWSGLSKIWTLDFELGLIRAAFQNFLEKQKALVNVH